MNLVGAVYLAAAFKERRRATVLGENTCGCVLGIRRRHKLPDGGTLEISEMDFRTATGERLEGEGVAPDELVRPTRRDLASGHDRALARAL
ncbi:MAG TPA: S41 family peptidase, partial [Pyrinomonadaceae bacterium]|nr:S41 family peptidase [Pyrinomonadaceae bacterium]